MKFNLPKTYKGKVIILDTVPEHLAPYAIPNALVHYVWCEKGEWLSQEIVGRHFSIYDHRFFLKKDLCIRAFFKTMCMTLNYNLKVDIPEHTDPSTAGSY